MIDGYLRYIADIRRYSERTVRIYADVLREYNDFCGGSLTVTDIRNYEVYLLDSKKESPRTVNLHLSVLSGYCRYLVGQKILASNPVRLVTRPKMPKRLPVFYRRDSMDEYFSSTESNADEGNMSMITGGDGVSKEVYERRLNRLVITLLYDTGIRRSELVSLSVGSVDTGRRVIRVLGKGDKMREIPVVSSLCKEISLYLQAREKMGVGASAQSDPLLVTAKGTALYPVLVDRIVKKELAQVSGITGRKSPHVLRHTIATELLDGGADLNSIKEMLGHSSLAATQVYTHNTIEKLKSVYNNVHPRAKRGGKNGD